jgi:hypothetical protein
VFQDGGQVDALGVPICNECGWLYPHRIHDLTVPEGSVEVANRIVGEGGS